MAVQSFQKDHNLPATGEPNMPTLRALNVQPDQTVMPQGNNAANNPRPSPSPNTNRQACSGAGGMPDLTRAVDSIDSW
jgi:peptidoglycan hydrolase-like protein with peptidoglycan-binding domain